MAEDEETHMPNADFALLAQRIAELEHTLAGARVAEQSERNRRLNAEESRDQWVSVVQTLGPPLGVDWRSVQDRVDPVLAINAANRREATAQRRVVEVEVELLRRDNLLGALAAFIRSLPKLPASPHKLPHEQLHALVWAFSESTGHRYTLLDAPALPVSVVAELRQIAEDYHAFARGHLRDIQGDGLAPGRAYPAKEGPTR